jgi:Golgi nucleoside diphosphatase
MNPIFIASAFHNISNYYIIISQKNQLVILKYEEKVSKIYGRRKQNYTMNEIKKMYKDCTIPPFTLETMKLVIETE